MARYPIPVRHAAQSTASPKAEIPMGIEARKISRLDSLRLQLHLSIPAFLLGLVVPNRLFLSLAARRGGGRATMRFLRELRDKYGCDRLWAWFPLRRTLLVFAPDAIDSVLRGDDNAPDPALKKRALSRFVPDALVISSGDEARGRRAFNVRALDLGALHRHADAFASIAIAEAERLTANRVPLRWADFRSLGERVSHQVILGAGRIDPESTKHLARMLRLSNVLLRHVPSFSAFYARIERWLAREEPTSSPSCLVRDAANSLVDGSAGESTEVATQIGFWFFVLKDAVELHVARTLALIAAHPEVQARVRSEILAAGTLSPQAIDGLRFLEACIAEQLRLWTPVPLLLRRAVRTFHLLERTEVEIGQQILIPAAFYHRDPRVFGDVADTFAPDAAMTGGFPAVYTFSAHGRSCAGRSLVMFVLKATLASLLRRSRFELAGPDVQPGRIAYIYDHFRIELRPLPDA
jgi:cytochrome P450